MKTFATAPAPHIPATPQVRRVMRDVLIALLPAIALQLWAFGAGLAFQLALAIAFGLAIESALLRLRGGAVGSGIADGSAVVTAVLFAVSIAPLAPGWVAAFGMLVALGLGKHAYGGLGANLFNPAMVGCAFVLVAFPHTFAGWPHEAVGLDEAARIIFSNGTNTIVDTVASATPLDAMRQLAADGLRQPEIRSHALYVQSNADHWLWIGAAYTLGGLYLLWRRVIGWHAPLGVIAGTLLLSLPFWLLDAELHPSPLQHLSSGSLLFAAWFIATDPVSGCTSRQGRLLFGLGVAAFTLAIRRWGHFPDGVAFAVLLMNALAPLIDRATRSRLYGHGHG